MSKRVLPGPHADRSAGVDFSMSSTPNDTPQRATAAQLATRKIKELNKRRVKPSTTPSAQNSFSFGETSTNTAAPPTNPPASNGFSFGQSQSFPGAGSTSTTQNGSQAVSFGSGGSTPFSFGTSFNAAPNNPFATMNGSTTSQPQGQTSNLFGGQSSSQPQGAMSSQPSSQGGLFGQTANSSSPFQSQPATTGSNLFGQSTAAPTSGSLFQSKPASNGSTSLFGQSTPASTNGPTNLFGQSSTAAPSSTSQPAAATPAPSIFGQQATTAPASSLFQPKPSTSTGSSLFGQNPPATTTGGSNMFGQPKPATTATTNMFGQSTAAPAPTSGTSLFGQSTTAKNESSPSTPSKPTGSIFGQASAAPAAGASNTLNFGQPAASAAQKPFFGAANDADEMSTSPDGKRKASEQSSTASTMFGQNAVQTSAPSASETTGSKPPVFGIQSTFKAAADPSSPSVGNSGSVFIQQHPRPGVPNGVSASASSPFAPSAAPSSTPNPFQSLFSGASQSAPAEKPATSAPATTSGPFQSVFGEASKPAFTSTPTEKSPAETAAATPQMFFSSPLSSNVSGNNSLFKSQLAPEKRLGGTIMDQGSAKATTTTSLQGPSAPSPDDSINNKRSQIRDLNRGFKELVSAYDPETQSLDGIILHYIRLRKAINAPVGSLTNKPGKRKLDDAHGIESPVQRSLAKKSRPEDAPLAVNSEPDLPSFGSKPSSSKRNRSEDSDDSSVNKRTAQPYVRPSTTQSGAAGKSDTASIFASSFSSGVKDKTPADAAPLFNQSTTTSNSSSPFASQPSAASDKEAPRPASPQKALPEPTTKPAFEVPKFNLAGSNFASQFGKGSFKESSKEVPKVNLEVPKFGASGQNFMSQFVQQAKGDDSDEDSSDSDAEPVAEKKVEKASSVQPEAKTTSSSIFDSKAGTPLPANNIFGHLTNSNTNSDAAESDDEEQTSQVDKPAITTQPASETGDSSESKGAASLFGRITRVDGTPVQFSSDEDRAETPKPKPIFGQSTSSPFFASSSSTPALFNSTPAPKTSNLFGAGSTSTPSFNPFSSINANPATHLLPKQIASTATSVTSDSNAEDTDTETYKDTQLNLMTNAGEEDEDCVYSGRSRGLKYAEKSGGSEKTWEVQGVGAVRLLVNRDTKKARIVLRAEPSGRAVLNTAISRSITYKIQPGSCSFLVPRPDGSGMDLWALRFKKEATEEFEKALNTAKDSLPK